jgi:hypothetical protein
MRPGSYLELGVGLQREPPSKLRQKVQRKRKCSDPQIIERLWSAAKEGGRGRESEAYVGVGGRGCDGAWRDGPAAGGGERGGASLSRGAAEGGGRRGSPADPESAPFHRRCGCSGEPAHGTNLNGASMNPNRCRSARSAPPS